MVNYVEKLKSGEELTPRDQIAIAADLSTMVATNGWLILSAMMLRLRQETLETGIKSPTNPVDYYRGKIDMIDELGGMVQLAIDAGAEAQQQEEKVRTVASPALKGLFKPQGGGFRE